MIHGIRQFRIPAKSFDKKDPPVAVERRSYPYRDGQADNQIRDVGPLDVHLEHFTLLLFEPVQLNVFKSKNTPPRDVSQEKKMNAFKNSFVQGFAPGQ